MNARELKSSILQLAVSGKLVPQNPTDEPASVLLKKIRAEKNRLIASGKIKRDKNESKICRKGNSFFETSDGKERCIDDEIPFEIPESWEWVKLKQIAISDLGKTLDKAKNTGNYHPYLCSINIYWSGIDLTTVKQAKFEDSELEKYRLKKGDLLICEGGDVGRSAVWNHDGEMFYQNALHRVRFFGGIHPEFFKILMECYKGTGILDRYGKGVTIKHLVQNSLNSIYFPLPPIQEQKRILEKLETILPLVKKYEEAEKLLDETDADFPERLKKSVLHLAVQGKLVPQNPDDEPASALLKKIRAEKNRLVQSGKLKRNKTDSVIRRSGNSFFETTEKTERCIDEELPFEIPESWEWCRLSSVIKLQSGQDMTPNKYNSASKGIPYITGASNIENGKVIINRWTEHGKTFAYEGNILLTCKGTVGTMAILKEPKVHIARQIMAITPSAELNTRYILLVLDYFVDKLKNAAKSMIPGISRENVLSTFLPLPPLAEQKRIVEKIEEILPLIENMQQK